MSNWRPGNWGDYQIIVGGKGEVPELFELGADAMLEALRKRGFHVDGDASFSSLAEHSTLSNIGNTGNYVFIPDDEV
jgi:hypothetical protein